MYKNSLNHGFLRFHDSYLQEVEKSDKDQKRCEKDFLVEHYIQVYELKS